jgi:hypothetical protein
MKNIKSLVFLLVICWCGVVVGQTKLRPEGKFCSTHEGRLEYISKISSEYYDRLLKKIERIPPDTEIYISQEYRDSLETRNEVKYNNVVSNKYFYPWILRNSVNKLIEESKDGYSRTRFQSIPQSDPREIEMIFYINLLDKNFDVKENYDIYSRFDRGRKPRVLNEEQDPFIFSLMNGGYQLVIKDLIRCSFKK